MEKVMNVPYENQDMEGVRQVALGHLAEKDKDIAFIKAENKQHMDKLVEQITEKNKEILDLEMEIVELKDLITKSKKVIKK